MLYQCDYIKCDIEPPQKLIASQHRSFKPDPIKGLDDRHVQRARLN